MTGNPNPRWFDGRPGGRGPDDAQPGVRSTPIHDIPWPGNPMLDAPVPDASIPDAFGVAVAADPNHVAVRTPHGAVTYAELDAMADGVATALGTQPSSDRPVVVLADHGLDAIAGVLGVVRSGRVALPLDPLDPPDALADAAERFGGGPVVTDEAHAGVPASWGVPGAPVVVGRDLSPAPSNAPRAPSTPDTPVVAVDPAGPATVSSTSGTTARPKAVVHSHRNVVANAARYRMAIGAQPSDVFVVVGSMAAQATATPLFAGLLGGATVATWDLRGRGAGGLPGFVAGTGGTVVHLPPAAMGAVPDIPMPTVRLVSLGGDRVTVGQLDRARTLFPNATVLCRYSTSETNWISGWAQAPGDPVPDEPPVAGHPVPWLGVRVTAPDGNDATEGSVGDIEVTGSHLALGYLDDPDRTVQRFVGTGPGRTFRTGDRGRWRADGSLEVVGRSDDVHNMRGTLVELAVVEAALERCDGVDTAAAVTGPAGRIVAFVTGPDCDGRRLRATVARRLPAAAVPTRVVVLEALPYTLRGKVDRRALEALAAQKPDSGGEQPVGNVEQHLAAIFAAAVGVDACGRHDDVFDLGADSLATVEILAAVGDRFGVELPPSVLLEHPTPDTLARWLDTTASAGSPVRRHRSVDRSVVRLTTGPPERTPVVIFTGGGGGHLTGAAMLAHRLKARTCYTPVPHGFESRRFPDRTIAAMGRRSAAAVASLGHDQLVFIGHSSGGSLALETARQLSDTGITVPLVVLLDTLAMTPEVLSKRRLSAWLRWSLANDRRQRTSRSRAHSVVADTKVVAGFGWRRLRQWWLATTAGVVVRRDRRQHDAFEALSRKALRRHPERPYGGDVLLVRADDNQWRDLPPDLRWSTVGLGRLNVVHTGGDHHHMLTEPQVGRIAAVVDEALTTI